MKRPVYIFANIHIYRSFQFRNLTFDIKLFSSYGLDIMVDAFDILKVKTYANVGKIEEKRQKSRDEVGGQKMSVFF